jgi:predicted nucleotidyltransferase component of viral defense system
MIQILKDIYSDAELANCLGFKGGSALMLFHALPRFSVDLDYNMLEKKKKDNVYKKIKKIVSKYGKIQDEAQKFYSTVIVLDYGLGERKLKIEISTRDTNDEYEICNLLGINIKTMTLTDMFSHKLCALLDRNSIINRDIFDCWFLMNRQTAVNKKIIEQRMHKSLSDYLQDCIEAIENLPNKSFLDGVGELVNHELKSFVKNKIRTEFLTLLRFYKDFS